MRRIGTLLVACTLSACAGITIPSGIGPSGAPSATTGSGVSVVRIVDGDTIVVSVGGRNGTKVRLIGIDTPETGDCMFRAAKERMRALVERNRVTLVRDVSERDRYGRLLRYVYAGEVFVNAAMVAEGFATAATFPPDVAHAIEFVAAERRARRARRGLWSGSCAP